MTNDGFVEVALADTIGEGEMRGVEVNGARVLLARVNGSLFAVEAVCSHEHAYLDQGSLFGHEVYCPLHFSSFDVRTGEVRAPPADSPLSTYAVKVVGGKILVSSTPAAPLIEGVQHADDIDKADDSDESDAASSCAPTRRQPPNAFWVMIEELAWLDAPCRFLNSKLKSLFTRRAVAPIKDILHGRWLGHALHPAVSDLPVGFWSGAVLFDATGDSKSAGRLSLAGTAASVVAFASGLADWSATDGKDRRVGVLHGGLNTAAMILQFGSYLARRAGNPNARVYSFVGWSIMVVASYLGGGLILHRGTMVDHTAWSAGPDEWTAVANIKELSQNSVHVASAEGMRVLLYKSENRLLCFEDTCSHAGASLARGSVRNGVITCPLHGAQFRIEDGDVVRGPACFPLRALATRVRNEAVEVRGQRHR